MTWAEAKEQEVMRNIVNTFNTLSKEKQEELLLKLSIKLVDNRAQSTQ